MLGPKRLVAVCGTGTDIGKTWVGAAMLTHLTKTGAVVAARKPVQSFHPDGARHTDAHSLAAATGESPSQVCPPHRWYEMALAPPMAAEALGRPPFTVVELMAELDWPAHCDVGLVETAGGVRSPIAADGDVAAFVRLLAPDVTLLVAEAGLGTINSVRLSLEALDSSRCVVLLNRFDRSIDLHRRNLQWLVERDRLTVLTDPVAAAERLLALS